MSTLDQLKAKAEAILNKAGKRAQRARTAVECADDLTAHAAEIRSNKKGEADGIEKLAAVIRKRENARKERQ